MWSDATLVYVKYILENLVLPCQGLCNEEKLSDNKFVDKLQHISFLILLYTILVAAPLQNCSVYR